MHELTPVCSPHRNCSDCALHFQFLLPVSVIVSRVRPIPCWRPIPDTIGCSCTDTDTNTGNNVTNVAHTVRTFQNIMPLTLCFEMYETNYRRETTGVHAAVLTVETGK